MIEQESLQDWRYVVIAGPTASGKSALAHDLAKKHGGEIINCDSVQLYRDFDIGTAKPSREERDDVPYHLIDRLDSEDDYDARMFADEARALIEQIRGRGRVPFVVGGTGLYLRALWGEQWHDLPKDPAIRRELEQRSNEALASELRSVDPERAQKIHINDRYRLIRAVELIRLRQGPVFVDAPVASSRRPEAFAVKMQWSRQHLHQRIEARTKAMLEAGLVHEVARLLARGCDPTAKAMRSIGYREVVAMLHGELDADQLPTKIAAATRQYAKRQETWFRKVEFDQYFTGKEACRAQLDTVVARIRPLVSV
jgi:tRNA dimethylallyltransferase